MEPGIIPLHPLSPVNQAIATGQSLSIEHLMRSLAKTPVPRRFEKRRQCLTQIRVGQGPIGGWCDVAFGIPPLGDPAQNLTLKVINKAPSDAVKDFVSVTSRILSFEDISRSLARTPTLKRFKRRRHQLQAGSLFKLSVEPVETATSNRLLEAGGGVLREGRPAEKQDVNPSSREPVHVDYPILLNSELRSAVISRGIVSMEEDIGFALQGKNFVPQESVSEVTTDTRQNPEGKPLIPAESGRIPRTSEVSMIQKCMNATIGGPTIDYNQSYQDVDLDLHTLQLDTNSDFSPTAAASLQKEVSPRTLKRAQISFDHGSSDQYERNCRVDDADDEGFGELSPRKRRRRPMPKNMEIAIRDTAVNSLHLQKASKQSLDDTGCRNNIASNRGQQQQEKRGEKMRPRRLPVNELALVSIRPINSDFDDISVKSKELSQDPISEYTEEDQSSIRESRYDKSRKSKQSMLARKSRVIRQRRSSLIINASQFSTPKPTDLFPKSKGGVQWKPTHSDGFDVVEATPIGRLMPIGRSIQSRSCIHKTTIRMGQLTLVAHREFGEPIDLRPKKSKPQQRSVSKEREANELLLFDGRHHKLVGDDRRNYPPQPVSISHPQKMPELVTTRHPTPSASLKASGSPLKLNRKLQFNRSLSTIDGVAICQQMMLVSAPSRHPERSDDSEGDVSSNSNAELEGSYSEQDSENSDEESNGDEEGEEQDEEDAEQEKEEGREENVSKVGELDHYFNIGIHDSVPLKRTTLSEVKELTRRNSCLNRQLTVQEKADTAEEVSHNEGLLSLTIRDPSALALEKCTKNIFKRANIDLKNARSTKKLHVSTTKRPPSAIKSCDITAGYTSEYMRKLYAHSDSSSSQNNDSWRPRKPVSNGILIKVEEDISDHFGPLSQQVSRSRRLRKDRSAYSPNTNSRRQCIHDSQGSIELGDIQKLRCRSPSPEIPESQYLAEIVVPETSYFSRASQQLSQPVGRIRNIVRTKSMPAHLHSRGQEEISTLPPEVIMTQMFSRTCSRSKSSSQKEDRKLPGQPKNLRTLTRQASLELGTIYNRRRTASLPFTPPFLKQ